MAATGEGSSQLPPYTRQMRQAAFPSSIGGSSIAAISGIACPMADLSPCCLDVTRLCGAHQVLEFGEDVLDRI
jgi:hypothetical protein